jgi:NAD-dependent SIR2 family protein deacetylase
LELRRASLLFTLAGPSSSLLPPSSSLLPPSSSQDARPSPAHCFISQLARRKKLLRNYTQNIDGLEVQAGVPSSLVVHCHGCLTESVCIRCQRRGDSSVLSGYLNTGAIPRCSRCPKGKKAWLKPGVTFFREDLPQEFHEKFAMDRFRADLFIVMGSSLSVKPVSQLIALLPPSVPAILINREVVAPAHEFDLELLGDCDTM